MFEWVASAVSSLAQWAFWTGRENGPAVGRGSRRAWRGLVLLGTAQFWVAVAVVVGVVFWWSLAT